MTGFEHAVALNVVSVKDGMIGNTNVVPEVVLSSFSELRQI
eukprot:CAMPEP_0168575912 /NCGR_PEP_ID=MMETSP0413-20121227/19954_1 /TAXON_ID=136452 /ORGANISM="Filamoeba nolandi, Strain NC-AS-23-1" /LENGTH=40 /DNA_ID= /DNA_START= /DNA_END= /DNA_ORIENTATION=